MDPRDVLELVAVDPHGPEPGGSEPDPAAGPDGLVGVRTLPARAADEVPLPPDLPAALRARLEQAGVTVLWRHQAQVRDLARAGRDVVVATGTASGKSLAYQLPVVESVLADGHASTLYLAPTKALARDQLRTLRALRLPQLRAAVVDGDTPRPERDAIRRTANVVLTNPDLVHHSLLPGHRHWADLLHRLAYVVVDEAHVARGVFGGHVALVLRRLRRVAERYGADPTFVLASATIGNPAEHATALVGREVAAVTTDGSPRGPLHLGLWQPRITDTRTGARRPLTRETGELLASFVGADVQTLAFVGSRNAAELVARRAGGVLGDTGRVAAYRAGYLPSERRELEDRLRSGELRGLAATTALELGIDVAGLDAVVLAGWPGTTASFRQRLGRAGRAGGPAVGVLVAGADLLDQYLVTHPDELLTRRPEDAIVDPANPYLLGPHLRCAAHEAPLDDDEAARWFGASAPAALRAEADAGRLVERARGVHWVGRRPPTSQVHLRGEGGQDVRIVDAQTGAVIGDVDASRALRQVHPGAVYLHRGLTHEVDVLDLDRGVALATPRPDLRHTTRARSSTDVAVLEVVEDRPLGDGVRVGLAVVSVTTQVTGYEVRLPGAERPTRVVDLDLPPTTLTTVASLWVLPEDVLAGAGIDRRRTPGALHAAEHAAIGMLPLLALCDRWDLGGVSTAHHPDTGLPSVFVYDGHPGGAGLAERSVARLDEHLRLTRDAVAGCPCETGCPSCVQSPKCGNGNDPLDKDGAVAVLDAVRTRL